MFGNGHRVGKLRCLKSLKSSNLRTWQACIKLMNTCFRLFIISASGLLLQFNMVGKKVLIHCVILSVRKWYLLVCLYLLDLLEETEKLMKEKVEVQRQAEKENADLLKHNKLLEAELEEQVSRVFELEQTHMTERGDLQQQIQALEKQLEKNRKFLDVSHRKNVQHSHSYAAGDPL